MSEENKGQWLSVNTLNVWFVRIIFILLTAGISYSIALDSNQDDKINDLDKRLTARESNAFTIQDGYTMQELILTQIDPRLDNIEKCLIRISNGGVCQDFE